MPANQALLNLLDAILSGGEEFLAGIHKASVSPADLLSAIVSWGELLNRNLGEILGGIEPCIRQSILMSLIPARAIDPSYRGSLDKVITEHAEALGIRLSEAHVKCLRDVCININRLRGLNRRQARVMSKSIGDL